MVLMFSKIIVDPRYDFSMNETSLEPEHISSTKEHPNSNAVENDNCDSENESSSGKNKTTVRQVRSANQSRITTSKHHRASELTKDQSSHLAKDSSVVRSLVERGCQINNNDSLLQVMHLYRYTPMENQLNDETQNQFN